MNSSSVYLRLLMMGYLAGIPTMGLAQAADADHAKHHPKDSKTKMEPKGPLAPLEKALDHNAPNLESKAKKSANQKPAKPPGMGGMGGGGMMDMMGGMMGSMMGSMPPAKDDRAATTSSELPGYPGASHIYHIGATGFFVDHADIVEFSTEQLESLNRIKEKSRAAQAAFEQKIEQAEEDLWQLTASDRPDIKSIEAKVKEIESIRGERRIKFIRDVGEAAGILSTEQRSILLGKST